MNDDAEVTGTARLLHELHEYTSIEREHGEEVAAAVTAKAAREFDPAFSPEQVKGAVRFCRALISGGVDIRGAMTDLEAAAARAADQLFRRASHGEEIGSERITRRGSRCPSPGHN